MLPIRVHIGGVNPVLLPQAKGNIVNALHCRNGVGVITVGNYAKGCQRGKLMERFLNILQILEIVQMVCFHIQDHRQSGEEIQERITVFAAFQQDRISMTHPMPCMEQG